MLRKCIAVSRALLLLVILIEMTKNYYMSLAQKIKAKADSEEEQEEMSPSQKSSQTFPPLNKSLVAGTSALHLQRTNQFTLGDTTHQDN
jgi:hypothetical protein